MGIKLVCDRCNKLRNNIKVYKVRGGVPLLVCPSCYAALNLLKNGYKPKKKKPSHKWVIPPGHHNKERMICNEDGSRGGVINQIDRNNSPLFKLTYYEHGQKIGYDIFTARETAKRRREHFLRYETIKTRKRDMKVTRDTLKTTKKRSQKAYDYIADYNKKNCRQFNLKLRIGEDADIIEELDSSTNKIETIRSWYQAYLKQNKGL